MKQTSFLQGSSRMPEMYLRGTLPKSNPWIVMVSTPNAPDGLFEKIEKNQRIPVSTSVYSSIIRMDLTKYTQEKR